MRLASVLRDGQPIVVADDGEGLRIVRGAEELGPATDVTWLAGARDRLGAEVDAEALVWRPVVPRPQRIICLGLNYRAHVEETGRELPAYPVLFTKWASSLAAAGDEIALPPESTQVDFEGELAVVVGRRGRRIPPEAALEHIGGVTIANDVTMRDYQYKTHQWLQGKAWDSSTPLGPYLVTQESVDLGEPLDLSLTLNGTEMQRSSTDYLIFDLATVVSLISEFTTLDVGDVILTGTPGGVGYRREPQVFLQPGDTTTVSVGGVGELTNTFAAERL